MKREIEFRGKTAKGEWVYGNLFQTEKWANILTVTNSANEKSVEYEQYKVIPETVGQYVGITDKNGKKVYEGDIIQGKIVSRWNKSVICCEVVYYNDGFISVEHTRNGDWVHKVRFSKDIEVIGNIHDNPELLKEGDNGD